MSKSRLVAWQRHVHPTDDSHRVTTLELFFDLVFVYALTQVTALMAADPTWRGGLRGPGACWACCGSAGRRTRGWATRPRPTRVCCGWRCVVAMGAMFVVALAIPERVRRPAAAASRAGCVLVAGLAAVRAVHLTVYFMAAGDDAGLRRQLVLTVRADRRLAPCCWWSARWPAARLRRLLWAARARRRLRRHLRLVARRRLAAERGGALRRAARAHHHHRDRRVDRRRSASARATLPVDRGRPARCAAGSRRSASRCGGSTSTWSRRWLSAS